MSLDADQFVDEGNLEAGLPVNVDVPEEPPVEETPQPEETPATETPAQESFLLQETDDEQPETEETTVPLHVVADLRAKNRELKQQLEQASTRPAAVNADVEPDPLAELDDDDFLTAGQIRAARKHDEAVAKQRQQADQQQRAETTAKADRRAFVQASEQATMKEHSDYLATMRAAQDYIAPSEIEAAMQTRNPAKVLYAKAKQLVSTLGIEVQTPVNSQPKQEPKQPHDDEIIQTDDEVFEELFPSAA